MAEQVRLSICHDWHCARPDCFKLHVCRRWLGGSCCDEYCRYDHRLRTKHNLKVCNRLEFLQGVNICDDATRFKLRKLFPATCFFYNYTKRGCNAGTTCDRLHVCARFLMGNCDSCLKSHELFSDQNSTILYRFDVTVSSRNAKEIIGNILISDSPDMEKTCDCNDCVRNKQERSFFTQKPAYAAEAISATARAKLRNTDSEDYEQNSDAESDTSSTNQGQRSFSNSDTDCPVSLTTQKLTLGNLLNALVQANGIVPYSALAMQFGLGDSFNVEEWSTEQGKVHQKQFAVIPSVFISGRQKLVSIQHYLRICIAYNFLGECSDPGCTFIHVCVLFVAGLCPAKVAAGAIDSEATCPRRLAHKLQGKTLKALGITTMPMEKQLELVRDAHPRVCELYNTKGCSSVSPSKLPSCKKLHICNKTIVSTNCACRLNHKFTDPSCILLLEQLQLASASYLKIKQTTLPCSINQSDYATFYSSNSPIARQTQQLSSYDSGYSTSEKPDTNLPESFGTSIRKVKLYDVVLFCIKNAASPCFATYEQLSEHFKLPLSFDWRAWCMHVRKPNAHDYEYMHRFYLHPIAFDWRDQRYLCVANAFRLCAYYQHPRCTNRNCTRLHVCARFIAGHCNQSKCPLKLEHAKEVDRCEVFNYLGLNAWTAAEKINLIRAAHPAVCWRYSYATCSAGNTCNQLHICNQSMLKNCTSDSCSLNHFMRTPHECDVLLRYGMNEMNEEAVCKLTMITSKDAGKNEPNVAVEKLGQQLRQTHVQDVTLPTTASNKRLPVQSVNLMNAREVVKPTLKSSQMFGTFDENPLDSDDNSKFTSLSQPYLRFRAEPADQSLSVKTDVKVLPVQVSERPKFLENQDDFSDKEFASFKCPDQNELQPKGSYPTMQSKKAEADETVTSKEPFLCERHIRGVCEFEDDCSLFHFDKPFCWIYKLDSEVGHDKSSGTNKSKSTQVMIQNEDGNLEVWYRFNDEISDRIERSYADPVQQSLKFFIDPANTYPFAYTCELCFSADRNAVSHLEARIKLPAKANSDERSRSALLKGTNSNLQSVRQHFSAPRSDIVVRSLRTKSHAMLPAVCTNATKWLWFYRGCFTVDASGVLKMNDSTRNLSDWLELSNLIGDANVSELEYQFSNGQKRYSARKRIDKQKILTFEFDLDALLLRCIADNGCYDAELISRPSYVRFERDA